VTSISSHTNRRRAFVLLAVAGEAFLIAMRAAQGLGAAVMLPAALSIVMNMFPEGAERNKALGICGGLGAAGGTVGLIAGGATE